MDLTSDLRWIAEELGRRGVAVEFVPGWERRGIGSFTAIRGQTNHHDAFPPSSGHAGGLRTCTFGRPGLRNALCMFYLASDGKVYVVSAKPAWHSGVCNVPGGNSVLSGIEARNNGLGEAWPAVQLNAYVHLNAACMKRWGYSLDKVQDHKEIAVPRGRKIDRTGIDPREWRAWLLSKLNQAPGSGGGGEQGKGRARVAALIRPESGPQKDHTYVAFDDGTRVYVPAEDFDIVARDLFKMGMIPSMSTYVASERTVRLFAEVQR